MLLWFLGGSLVCAWAVFRDPAVDYRLVMVGAVLPDLVDALGLTAVDVAHSVTTSVVLLVVVMLATIGRRSLRRHLLALPIGTFLHLVLDGAFTDTARFWWPLAGRVDADRLPSVERGWWNAVLEIAGALALAWGWKRFGLGDADRRRRFLVTGRFDPALR